MRSSRSIALAGFFLAILATINPFVFAQAPPAPPPAPVVGIKLQPGVIVRPASTAPAESVVSDEDALKSAGISPDDGQRLIEYLKQRTLSDADQGKISAIIKRFGADDFDDRAKATEEIEFFGPAALGPLKTAERDADPEVAYRAKMVLKRMTKVPHSAVAAAAVRAIVKLKPDGAAAALIGFLPLADDDSVAELIRESLIGLAVRSGKAEPALVAALADASPVRRSAAYLALTHGGPVTERIRIKDAYPALKAAVLRDKDPETKFTGLWALLMTTRNKEFLPELIDLIPAMSRGHLWQLEDVLLQFAGAHPKDGRFLKSGESLARARDAWAAWWKEAGPKIDLEKDGLKPRIQGVTDLIEMDYRGFGQGRIVSLGPDFKEKWKLVGVNNPTDAVFIGPDRLMVAEPSGQAVTERNLAGTILNRRVMNQPLRILPGENGTMVVVCRSQVHEFDKEGAIKASYQRGNDIMSGVRLPGGDVLIVTGGFPVKGANGIRLDSKLKDTGKSYTFGQVQTLQWMDVVGDDHVLLCETIIEGGDRKGRVAEYDLKTGKLAWRHDCRGPTSCQRLLNGNTLICLLDANQVIEVDPSGEVVWDYEAKEGLRVGRARRR